MHGRAYTPAVAKLEETAAQTHLEWDTPLFQTAIAQFEQALPYADISEAVAERLRYPERAVMLSVPVRIDDDRRVVFAGYRVQHSTRARADEGRHPLRPGGDARRVRGARGLDDVEVRAARACRTAARRAACAATRAQMSPASSSA